jgi:hypothetical protein
MKNRGAVGWLILVLALAVPGVLFFNWWSKMDKEKKKQLSFSVRKRTEGLPFAGPANKNKLTNPVAQVPAPLPASLPAEPEVLVASGAAATSLVPPATPLPPEPSLAVPLDFPTRDPMLSPYDLVRMKRQELERMLATSALSPKALPKKMIPADPPIENSIDLQGIIFAAGGVNKAIVNGEVVGEGDMVDSALVLKISKQSVVFRHKNRKFTKVVNK